MKDYDENKESSYLKYWEVNNLYGWAMLRKLPVNNFGWIKDTSQFNEDFMKSYNEENDEEYLHKVDVQYPGKIHDLCNDLPFLPERIKIEKVKELVTNLHDKSDYVILIRNLKQELNYRLVLKKVHRVIKCDQEAWPKPYIDMDTNLRKHNTYSSWWKCSFSKNYGKCWHRKENIEILNL